MHAVALIIFFACVAAWWDDNKRRRYQQEKHINWMNAEARRLSGLPPEPAPFVPRPLVKYEWQVLLVPYIVIMLLICLGFVGMVVYYG